MMWLAPPTSSGLTVDGKVYIHTLASFVRENESKLADYARRKPVETAPSWTTILTLGVLSSEVPVARKPPLILKFDPHHLYYLLLKFDEAGMGGSGGIGALDVRIDGGTSRPMSINYADMGGVIPTRNNGMLGLDSDAVSLRSTFSAVSTFSLGSGWWGSSAPPPDESADVRFLYSSCTKLPALRLAPFTFSSTVQPTSATPTLSKPVKDFQDCPPPETAVPLYAFKNLQSLSLEDLDPRGFLGWDVLSTELRSLEVKRSGMEDIGELLCDAVVEDVERRKKGRGGVGEERRRRQGLSTDSDVPAPPTKDVIDVGEPSPYPVPPPHAWCRLRYLSLASNSLTFVPSSPLINLTALTSLDLSSNLLIAIPPGLSHLHSLRSLNLQDNMIESLLGISKALGNVNVINLSHNRIDNLSGLDRVFALERLDLRHNRLTESLEVSRLATLPHLQEVWIEGNPFTTPYIEGGEEGYRVKCFSYFEKEDRTGVLLDGTPPGMNERRALDQLVQNRGKLLARRASTNALAAKREEASNSGQAKIVGRRVVTTPHSSRVAKPNGGPPLPGHATSSSPPATAGLTGDSPSKSKPRRRKPRRIVDLDGLPAGSNSAGLGDLSGTEGDSDKTSSPVLAPARTTGKQALPKQVALPEIEILSSEDGGSADVSARAFGHARYPTSPAGSTSEAGTMAKKQSRRERVSASAFEPPTKGDDLFQAKTGPAGSSAEEFRKKIEALRSEVGESWLSVLGEREAAAERKSQSEESGKEDPKQKQKAKEEEEEGAAAAVETKVLDEEGGTIPEVKQGEEESPAVVKVVKGKKKKKKKGK